MGTPKVYGRGDAPVWTPQSIVWVLYRAVHAKQVEKPKIRLVKGIREKFREMARPQYARAGALLARGWSEADAAQPYAVAGGLVVPRRLRLAPERDIERVVLALTFATDESYPGPNVKIENTGWAKSSFRFRPWSNLALTTDEASYLLEAIEAALKEGAPDGVRLTAAMAGAVAHATDLCEYQADPQTRGRAPVFGAEYDRAGDPNEPEVASGEHAEAADAADWEAVRAVPTLPVAAPGEPAAAPAPSPKDV